MNYKDEHGRRDIFNRYCWSFADLFGGVSHIFNLFYSYKESDFESLFIVYTSNFCMQDFADTFRLGTAAYKNNSLTQSSLVTFHALSVISRGLI